MREALTVGVGMCGRAEMAFILASLALAQGAIDKPIFTVLILTAFILNLFTPLALKGCAVLLQGKAARLAGATRGIMQIDKFSDPLFEERLNGQVPRALPDVEDGVVIYRYGPEVDSLIDELKSRDLPVLIIEEDETVARRLHERGESVVYATLEAEDFDLSPLAKSRALVANGEDDRNAIFAMGAREAGFVGPLVATIANPNRLGPMILAGATAAFTPSHVLAAAIAVRASPRISPLVAGLQPLHDHLEIAEIRLHDASKLAGSTLAQCKIRSKTGANIVGQWFDDELHSPPAPHDNLLPGMILVAAGSPASIRTLSDLAHPLTQEGPLVVVGYGIVGKKLVEFLRDAGEEVCVMDSEAQSGVDVVGDLLDTEAFEQAGIRHARAVIIALAHDSTTIFTTTVIRNFAPEVPIFARVDRVKNVGRIHKAGADFVLSTSQVMVQIMTRHVLGHNVSHQTRIKLVKVHPAKLTGKNPLASRIRELTGCSVVAVERQGQLVLNIDSSFELSKEDAIYICGSADAVNRYYDEFPTSQM